MSFIKRFWILRSLAERLGFIAVALSGLLLGLGLCSAAVLLLVAYVSICLIAPFCPRLGFFHPVVIKGASGKRAVALTFDDGPHPDSTPALLRLLARYEVKATFFVLGKSAEKWPELLRDILQQDHELGNHSYAHDPLLMLKSSSRLRAELEKAQKAIKEQGVVSLAFRPPAGISNPRLKPVLEKNNLFVVNFSCTGADFGNRRLDYLSSRILRKMHSEDIVLLHDRPSKDPEQTSYWLSEVEQLIIETQARGFEILPLSELIKRPVMKLV